jgi:type VI protein secretion system component Hcp
VNYQGCGKDKPRRRQSLPAAPAVHAAYAANVWTLRQCFSEEHVMPEAYYLKLGSGAGQVLGASRDRYHMGWIKLVSFSPDAGAGGGGGGAGRARISQFLVTKLEDRTSPEIFLAVHSGRHFRSADLDVADARTGIPKVRFSFTDVLLGSHKAHADTSPSFPARGETFSLNFVSMKMTHNPTPEETVGDIVQSVFKSLGLDALR